MSPHFPSKVLLPLGPGLWQSKPSARCGAFCRLSGREDLPAQLVGKPCTRNPRDYSWLVRRQRSETVAVIFGEASISAPKMNDVTESYVWRMLPDELLQSCVKTFLFCPSNCEVRCLVAYYCQLARLWGYVCVLGRDSAALFA